MTDRLEEIERRLAQRPKNGGLAVPSWSDIKFLLGKVRKLMVESLENHALSEIHRKLHSEAVRENITMGEAAHESQSLALSLADALSDLLADTQHENHYCGDDDCPVRVARVALSDERLTKLRKMKNGN